MPPLYDCGSPECSQCEMAFRGKPCPHSWETSGGWGVIIGMSRCRVCGVLATAEHFPRRRHKADPGECAQCDTERPMGADFHPPHDASPNCESGKHAHCSCDVCF